MLSKNSNGHHFSLSCMIEAHDKSRCSKMSNGSSQQIQKVISFHSDVRFRRIIYRDPRNWTRMVSAISNGHNFWLNCMFDAHDILRHSQMNNRSSREIQKVKNFHSDVRFRRIIYRDARNWTRKLLANSNGHNFWLGCMIDTHDTSRHSKMNYGCYQEIQMVINFHSDIRFRRIIYRDARNSTRKIFANSNGHNFWLGCMIEAHDISRCSKLNNGSCQKIQMVITFHLDVQFMRIIHRDSRNWTRKLSANSNDHNFWVGCMIDAHDISRRSKLNNRCSRKIQTVITFHLDVRFKWIIYRDARNITQKLSANSNGRNFCHGCTIEAHDISRRSKMIRGSSQEIQMVITFHSDVRFRRIIYRDARNWTAKLLANSNGNNFWLGCMIDAHDISRRSKMNNGSSREIQTVITFHSDVWFRCIINRDSRNWTRKLSTNSNGHNFWVGCMIDPHDILRCSKLNNRCSRKIQTVITFHLVVWLRPMISQDTKKWATEATEKFKRS